MSAVVVLAVGVAAVVLLPIAWRVGRRRFDPFEPIVVFALAWGMMFVVRPIAIVIRDDTNFYGVDIGPTLDKAVLLGLVGAVAFVVGHELSLGRGLASRLPLHVDGDLPPRTLWLAASVGLLATLALFGYLLTAGGTEAVEQFFAGRSRDFNALLRGSTLYLWWLSLAVVPAALVAVDVAFSSRRSSAILVAAALVGLVLLRTLPTGSRLYLMMLVGGALVFVYLHRRRRPGIVAVAVGLSIALAGSYAVLLLRDSETRTSVSAVLEEIAATPSRVFSPVVKGPDAEMAPALAGALLAVPSELPHRYGAATIGDLLARPIPSGLWSGKPELHTTVVTEEVWPVAREAGDFQPTFTPLLSFYWDFGLLGAFLGLALYGVLARLVYEYLLRAPGSALVQLLYALALWTIVVAVRLDPVLLVVHCVITFVPVLAIAAVGSSRRPTAVPVLQ